MKNLMLLARLWAQRGFGSRRPDALEGVDIESEYKLIRQKKSRLSRSLRDLVVYRYESEKKE